jgi:hypothetical protein
VNVTARSTVMCADSRNRPTSGDGESEGTRLGSRKEQARTCSGGSNNSAVDHEASF